MSKYSQQAIDYENVRAKRETEIQNFFGKREEFLDSMSKQEPQQTPAQQEKRGNMSVAMSPMPKYKCHKEVWALKIKEVVENTPPSETPQAAQILLVFDRFAPMPISNEFYAKHNPQKGGYFVRYEDGYESYSPAKAFEEGYTKI